MVVEDGYKQTDVGVIPSDWNVEKLGNVAIFFNGKAHENYISDIGDYVVVNSKFISSDGKIAKFSLKNDCKLSENDITIVMSDIPNGKALAKCFIIDKNDIYALNQRIGGLRTLCAFPKYLFYQLNRNTYFLSYDSGSGQTNLRKQEVLDCPVIIPPLPEQTAIATALSDMDTLIAQTEKLIEKKKAIKQGVMQELLRPKEGWEKKKISEAFNIFKGRGLSKNKISEYGEYPCILYGELFTTYKEEITEIFSKTNYSEAVNSVEGDILFPGSTTTTGADLAKASAIFKDGVQLGGDIIILRKYDFNLDSLFVTNFLNYYRKNEIAQLTKGITIHHLYGKDLSGIEIEFPNQSIQMSISNASRDFDLEISSLQKKLQKLIFEKHGMMQALLTGKIRLV